jgi:FMN phosphatase YigB (HAD superfamily)
MRGILFDLDGTLLDLDLGAFLMRYFAALDEAAAGHFGVESLSPDVSAATQAMMDAHPGETNRDAFVRAFLARTGIDISQHWDVFDRFYAERFPGLQADARPAKGARRAVEAALELGLPVAIATNPIFPLAAIRHRLDWAGLGDLALPVVTSYESMHATKPLAAYFRETSELLGVPPADCLMVGDDPMLDLAAADVGMRTFYVGGRTEVAADYRGDLDDLAALLPRLSDVA